MDAPSPALPTDSQETRATVLLREALKIMQPLAEALVANGVTYPRFAQELKSVFLEAARRELEAEGKKTTDSALSLLSGVHRKDVRSLGGSKGAALAINRAMSLANEVATRWLTDRTFLNEDGSPRALLVRQREDSSSDKQPSFEQLAQSVSKDFHARSVLDELQRLGLVQLEGDMVKLHASGFVPQQDFTQYAAFFGDNLRDHASASAANLRSTQRGEEPGFLEYAVFADELSEKSVTQLQALARTLWRTAFQELREAAQHHVELNRPKLNGARGMRLKFGVYVYSEDAEPQADAAGDSTDGAAAENQH